MTKQQKIAEWFDQTYKIRGNSYLRPKEAYYIFLKLLDTKMGDNLLDVACGLGRLLSVAAEKGLKPTGIDISKVAIEHCWEKFPSIPTSLGNAEDLPFKSQSFDYVTCLGSLERMLDRDKVLQELSRVLKNDGAICILVRNSNSWKWKFIKKPFGLVNKQGHQDAMTFDKWVELLERNGLKVTNTYCDQWPLMKFKFLTTFGLWRNFEKNQSSPFAIKLANEFVFLVKKNLK
jgi:ubiquinone/menaquinone biosynthesis C-methylase UbiE